MACGVPVVCSDAASLPEAAGKAAVMVDATQPEALRAGLQQVLDDAALAASLRSRGLERARAMSWDRAAAELRQLYRDVGGI